MAKRKSEPVEMTEQSLERFAHLFGESSASSEALADLRARKAAGQDAIAYRYGSTIFVGPRIATGEPESRRVPTRCGDET